MKAVKLVLFLLVCVFLVIVIVQNQGVFMDKKALEVDLVVWNYETQPIHLSLYFLGFFLIGLLVSYFYGLGERFKAKRIIASQLETIRKSEEEIRGYKNQPNVEEETFSTSSSENGGA
jgi:uncharacterized integral membrane protein